jgi:tetratricopeptide (TPR) repeat protein
MKARHYIEEKEYGKAEMFLLKAKECTDMNENGEALEELLKYVNNHKKEYEKRKEKMEEAESLMDKADEILWDNQFEEAQTLYRKASKIHKELGNEFGVSFCESRITYIRGKVPEDTETIGKSHSIVLVIAILTILFSTIIFLTKRRSIT